METTVKYPLIDSPVYFRDKDEWTVMISWREYSDAQMYYEYLMKEFAEE